MRTLLNIGRIGLAAMLSALFVGAGPATAAEGWRLEEGVSAPSYAVAEPVHSTLNIDVVALVCEEAGRERVLAPGAGLPLRGNRRDGWLPRDAPALCHVPSRRPLLLRPPSAS